MQLFEYFNFVMNSNNWFLSSLTCAPLNSYPGNSIFSPNNFSSFFSTNCLSNIVMWSPCLLKHTPNFRDVLTKFYFSLYLDQKIKANTLRSSEAGFRHFLPPTRTFLTDRVKGVFKIDSDKFSQLVNSIQSLIKHCSRLFKMFTNTNEKTTHR